MMGKMREEFESVFNPPEWSGFDGVSNDYFLLWSELDWRDVDEELTRYNRDWHVWQASRATMRVRLPEVTGRCHYAYDPDELITALTDAGISYD